MISSNNFKYIFIIAAITILAIILILILIISKRECNFPGLTLTQINNQTSSEYIYKDNIIIGNYIYYCGYTYESSERISGFVKKFDLELDIQTDFAVQGILTVNNSKNFTCYNKFVIENNSIFVIGITSDSLSSSPINAILTEIDKNGVILYNHIFTTDLGSSFIQNTTDYGNIGIQTNVYIKIYKDIFLIAGNLISSYYIAKLDNNHITLTTSSFNKKEKSYLSGIELIDNIVAAIGISYNSLTPYSSYIYITDFNISDLTTLTHKTIDILVTVLNVNYNLLRSITIDDEIVLCYSPYISDETNYNMSTMITRIDKDGNLTNKHIIVNENAIPTGLFFINNNVFVTGTKFLTESPLTTIAYLIVYNKTLDVECNYLEYNMFEGYNYIPYYNTSIAVSRDKQIFISVDLTTEESIIVNEFSRKLTKRIQPLNQELQNLTISSLVKINGKQENINSTGTFGLEGFITVWDTQGSSNIILPLTPNGEYNFEVIYNGNMIATVTSYTQNIITFPDGPGIKLLAMYGAENTTGLLTGFSFNNTGDREKITEIVQWGNTFELGNNGGGFYGCSNLIITAVDLPNMTNTTTLLNTFRNCTNLTTGDNFKNLNVSSVTNFSYIFSNTTKFNLNLNTWNFSSAINLTSAFENSILFTNGDTDINWNTLNVTTFENCFKDCGNFIQNVNLLDTSSAVNIAGCFENCVLFNNGGVDVLWQTSNITNMNRTFYNNTSFVQNINTWDFTALTSAIDIFTDSSYSIIVEDPTPYDNLLIHLDSQFLNQNVIFNAGSARYNCGDGEEAKLNLQLIDNWTITDGGSTGDCSFTSIWTNTDVIKLPLVNGGNYSFQVYYDGNMIKEVTSASSNTINFIDGVGTKLIRIEGTLEGWSFENSPYSPTTDKLASIIQWGGMKFSSATTQTTGQFNGCVNLDLFQATDTPDLTNTVSLQNCFKNCSLTALSVNPNSIIWDMSNITNMSSMFEGAYQFNQDISLWNVGSVTTMSNMFNGALLFNQNISSWSVGNVTDISNMFNRATAFNQSLSWNLPNLTNITNAFVGATALTSLTLGTLSSLTSLTSTENPFGGSGITTLSLQGLTALTSLNALFSTNTIIANVTLGGTTGSLTNLQNTFNGCTALTTVNITDTLSGITTLEGCFQGATLFNQDIGLWNVSSVTNIKNIFNGATSFNKSLSWSLPNLTNITNAFVGATSLTTLILNNLGSITSLTSTEDPFSNSGLTTVTLQGLISLTTLNGLFSNNTTIANITIGGTTASLTNMQDVFNGCTSLLTVNMTGTMLGVTTLQGCFQGATLFNQDIGTWIIGNVTNISNIFNGATSFNKSLSWSLPNLTNITNAFIGTTALTTLTLVDLNSLISLTSIEDPFSSSGLTTLTLQGLTFLASLNGLFSGNTIIANVTIGGTTNALLNMQNTFNGCTALTTVNITGSTLGVTTLEGCFQGATSFNQDIGSWNVENVENMANILNGATSFTSSLSWTLPFLINMTNAFVGTTSLTSLVLNNLNSLTTLTSTENPFGSSGLTIVTLLGLSAITTLNGLFSSNTTIANVTIGNTTSSLLNMQDTFNGCTALSTVTMTGSLSGVTNIQNCFQGATTFNQSLSWSLPSLTNITNAFVGATSLTSLILTDLNSLTSLTSTEDPFSSSGINTLDLQGLSALISLDALFFANTIIESVTLGGTTTTLTNMQNTFNGCTSLTTVNILNTMSAITTFQGCFQGATSFNQDIGTWNVSSAINMIDMFNGAAAYNQSIENWNIQNVTNMSNMLNNTSFDTSNYNYLLINWSQLVVQNNVNLGVSGTKYSCSVQSYRDTLTTTYSWIITDNGSIPIGCNLPFISTWNLSTTTLDLPLQIDGNYEFSVTANDINPFPTVITDYSENITFDTSGIKTISCFGLINGWSFNNTGDRERLISIDSWGGGNDFTVNNGIIQYPGTFYGCTNLTSIPNNVLDLSGVTTMENFFRNCSSFNTALNINNWNVSLITNMNNLFNGATVFNQTISGWNVSNVTTMAGMFNGASAFNQSLSWSLPNLINITSAFANTPALLSLILLNLNSLTSLTSTENPFSGSSLTTVNLQGMTILASLNSLFSGNTTIASVTIGGTTTALLNMQNTFNGCTSLITVNITDITSGVTTLEGCFQNASSFNQDIGSWNVSSVTNIANIFNGAIAFNQTLSWSLPSLSNITGAFVNTTALTSIILNNLNSLTSLTSAENPFSGSGLTTVNLQGLTFLSSLNSLFSGNTTIASVTIGGTTTALLNMQNTFNGCTALTTANITGSTLGVTTLEGCFQGATSFNQDIGSWNVENVENMANILNGATSFTSSLSWSLPFLTNMTNAFVGATSLSSLVLNTLNSLVSLTSTENPFGSSGLTIVTLLGLSALTTLNGLFFGNTTITNVTIGNTTSSLLNMQNTFNGCTALTSVTISGTTSGVTTLEGCFQGATSYNQDIGSWNVSSVVNIANVFNGATLFNQTLSWSLPSLTNMTNAFVGASALTSIILNNLTSLTTLTSTENPFGSSGLTTVNLQGLSILTTLNALFSGNTNITNVTLGGTTALLTNMQNTFNGCTSLQSVTITGTTSGVTTLEGCFQGATSFNQNIESWNVSSVVNMSNMFNGAISFNQDIGLWDVINVTNMANMFNGASSFNQDISSWDIRNVTDMTSMLDNTAFDTINYDALLLAWSNIALTVGVQPNVTLGVGNVKYNQIEAKNILTNPPNNWIITDGGEAPTVLPLTAFGTLNVGKETTEVTANFAYNLINTKLFISSELNGGTVTASNSLAVLQTNTTANGSAILFSNNTCKYQNGTGVVCRFTAVYMTGITNNRQYVGVGNEQNGFFVGYTETDFSICRRKNGIDNTVIQSSFNTDTLNGAGPSGMTIIPSNGNVYQIVYQWLGYGMITFSIEEPISGQFIVFHTIQYANANTEVSVVNPTYPIRWENVNFNGNTTNVTLRSSSAQVAIQGKRVYIGPSFGHIKNVSAATSNLVYTAIRNKPLYNGLTNSISVLITFSSIVNTNTGANVFSIARNVDIPDGLWVDVDTNDSVVEYNDTATSFTPNANTELFTRVTLIPNKSITYNSSQKFVFLGPNENLIIYAANSTTRGIAVVNWKEIN